MKSSSSLSSSSSEGSPSSTKISKSTVLLSMGLTSLGFALVVGPFLMPAARKLTIPWMATPVSVIRLALDKMPSNVPINQRRLIDLGSGDGRFVIEAAKRGYDKAVGIELNPWLVIHSYYRSFRAGVFGNVSFKMVNFFSVDIKEFDVITIFGANGIMEPLCDKIKVEAKDTALVVCYRFPLSGKKKPIFKDGELYIYAKKDI